jgi:hypothetical protein
MKVHIETKDYAHIDSKKKPRIYNKNIDMGQKCYLKGYDLPASTIALPPLQIGKKIRGTKLWGPKKHTKVCT